MIYALTGTPGTGKTTIAKELVEKGIQIIDLKELALTHKFIDSIDKSRDSFIIDLDSVNKYLSRTVNANETVLIEGHLAHLLDGIDQCIVLRCHPKVLRNRLSNRDWSWNKIKENIEAEILDVILCEAAERFQKEELFEIDTSDIEMKTIVNDIYFLLNGKKTKYLKNAGTFDWSELIFDTNIMEEKANGA